MMIYLEEVTDMRDNIVIIRKSILALAVFVIFITACTLLGARQERRYAEEHSAPVSVDKEDEYNDVDFPVNESLYENFSVEEDGGCVTSAVCVHNGVSYRLTEEEYVAIMSGADPEDILAERHKNNESNENNETNESNESNE